MIARRTLTPPTDANRAPTRARLDRMVRLWGQFRLRLTALGEDTDAWQQRIVKLQEDLSREVASECRFRHVCGAY